MMPFPRDMIPLMPCEYMPLFQKIYVWDVYIFLVTSLKLTKTPRLSAVAGTIHPG